VKQVIIVRKDLNMRKGKMIAQGAHASVAIILEWGVSRDGEHSNPAHMSDFVRWYNAGGTKITVYVNSEKELLDLYQRALDDGLYCSLIKDEGRTEFKGVPTYTAVAIGPDEDAKVDALTKALSLL
jgi:peptidyl-tRNA hydrolase, PTH2 family